MSRLGSASGRGRRSQTAASVTERAEALARANRAAGQAAAVAEMIRNGQPHCAVVQQVLATQGSLDALLLRLVQQEVDRQAAAPDGAQPDLRLLLRPILRRGRSPGRAPLDPIASPHQPTEHPEEARP